MTDRATCWSITWNNPQEDEIQRIELPAGWRLQGQLERGEQGTEHYQGMLITPQVRFSAVKKVLPKAHIEVARNRKALEKYVNKEDTRVKKIEDVYSRIPTLFEYQIIIAEKWVEDEFVRRWKASIETDKVPDIDELAMRYIDSLVAADIESGRRGAEFIAINPMWRASWKKFWRSIINRNASCPPPEEAAAPPSSDEAAPPADGV